MLYTRENTIDIGKPVRVFVDGKEVFRCFEADTEAGYVELAKLNQSGLIYIDENAEIATRTIRGKVTVEPLE